MNDSDDRDDWLEGVRRWYFGGTPGPDDEVGACADVESRGKVIPWQAEKSPSPFA